MPLNDLLLGFRVLLIEPKRLDLFNHIITKVKRVLEHRII